MVSNCKNSENNNFKARYIIPKEISCRDVELKKEFFESLERILNLLIVHKGEREEFLDDLESGNIKVDPIVLEKLIKTTNEDIDKAIIDIKVINDIIDYF